MLRGLVAILALFVTAATPQAVARSSTIALADDTGRIFERLTYDAYGAARLRRAGDLDGDGSTNSLDENILLSQFGPNVHIADLDFDGDVDAADQALLVASYGGPPPAGQLSLVDNVLGFAGYMFNAETQHYCVRNRTYDTITGRWLERDPAGYIDGSSLYESCASSPAVFSDPLGLASRAQLPAELWVDNLILSRRAWSDYGGDKIDFDTLVTRLRCLDSIENEWMAQHAREVYDKENSVLYKLEGSATLVGDFLTAGLLDTYLNAWEIRTADQYQGWGFDAARFALRISGYAAMFLRPGGTLGVMIQMIDMAFASHNAFMLGYSIGRGDWSSAAMYGLGTVMGAYGAGGPNLRIGGAMARAESAAVKSAGNAAARAQTGAGRFSGSADQAYDAIRASTRDVTEIAAHTGIKAANIQRVKDHLFMDEHLLDRFVNQGIPARTGRFESDLGIAEAWKRLREGRYTPADIQLLKHEAAEAWFMRRHGPSYGAAHTAADARFPSPLR